MLDGIFLSKLIEEIKPKIINTRIDSIDGLSKTDFIFKLRGQGFNQNLFISISSLNPSIFLINTKEEKEIVASNFTMYLRKHLLGGYISNIKQLNNDRIVLIDITKKDEFLGYSNLKIVVELIGRFSNLLILDSNNKILDAIKEASILESNRGVMKGMTYIPPINNKVSIYDESIKNYFNDDKINQKDIMDYISGVSKDLALYIENTYREFDIKFTDLLKDILNKYEPTLYNNDFYFFDIKGNGIKYKDLSNLLNDYYLNNAKEKSLKDSNQEVFRVIKSNKKRLEKKLDKLNDELEKSNDVDSYRLKGELLLANSFLDFRGNEIKLNNYYDNSEITISLNPTKSIKDNSLDYYKKYKKIKNSVIYIKREIEYSNNEFEYFNELESQVNKASLKDLIEIKNELVNNYYLKEKKEIKKSKVKPNYLSFIVDECTIYVGKNNIQNNYITHTLAKKDDYFFHVKDGHGSHVIVSGINKDNENVIRFAALKASEYSSLSDSSSVPVDYTLVKNLKKIPGNKGSKVTYTKYKTIYVDPKREK